MDSAFDVLQNTPSPPLPKKPKSRAKVADATCILPFSLANQIEERDLGKPNFLHRASKPGRTRRTVVLMARNKKYFSFHFYRFYTRFYFRDKLGTLQQPYIKYVALPGSFQTEKHAGLWCFPTGVSAASGQLLHMLLHKFGFFTR